VNHGAGKPTAQASEVTYELHSLGWKAFQDLCLTVLGEILGQTVIVVQATRDGGRDGAFSGQWEPKGELRLSGSFTLQCKFTSKRGETLVLSKLSDELAKAARLATKGLCDNYILMTNLALTGPNEEKISEAFREVGVKCVVTLGYEWICLKIRESSRLRMLVPRVYGLGDLPKIIDQRAYDQTKEILDSIEDELKKFVRTDSHRKAATALMKRGFVLLLGEPASGKSMIASVLAVGANDMWNCVPIRVADAEQFRKHWDPREQQFFWVDDAFGSTIYQSELAAKWNQQFQALSAAINKGARVLFTSRDYVFQAAKKDLKASAFPLIAESQVIIDVQSLSQSEKEQIVYNHVKLGDQTRAFRRRVKPYLPDVSRIPHFLPEIARRLGTRFFTRGLTLSREAIVRFAENPVDILDEILSGLSHNNRAALAVIFMNNGRKESPLDFTEKERTAIERLGGTLNGALEGLQQLEGSLVKRDRVGARVFWIFRHPTIRDAFATLVSRDPELLDIYLEGTPLERVLGEVSCGDIGFAGVKVIIPESRFARIASELHSLHDQNDWSAKYRCFGFLARRCSRDFLRFYVGAHPSICQEIAASGGAYTPETSLVVRLNAFELLPEAARQRFVRHVQEMCVIDPAEDFLSQEAIKGLFRDDELEATRTIVKEEVLPNISEIVSEHASNFDADNEIPEDHFADLRSTLQRYSDEFAQDTEARALIEAGLQTIRDAISDLRDELPREPDYDDERSWESAGKDSIARERSIFDDVDE